jgi:hypothetical protein
MAIRDDRFLYTDDDLPGLTLYDKGGNELPKVVKIRSRIVLKMMVPTQESDPTAGN